MSDVSNERIRDRNPLIQSGYQGSAQPGANALAVSQPELTEADIKRLQNQVSDIDLSIGNYADLLAGLEMSLTPDGYLNFDPIVLGGTGTGTVFVQGTVVTYSSGTGTATVGAQTVSFTNTTGLGIYPSDVVLLGLQSGTYYLVGIISRAAQYIPPSYIAPSYTGFPLNGLVLGDGIKTATSGTTHVRSFVDFDASGVLGLGTNCYVGFYNANGTYKVLTHSITTATTSDLSWPAGFAPGAGTPPQLMIVADAIVLKVSNTAAQPLYIWRLSTGWVTINTPGGVSDRFFRMTVSGTEYIVVSRSGVGWYYYNIGTATWSTAVAFPSGATRVAAKGGYMWSNNGYVAAASLTPSWTLRHSGLSVATQMDNLRADISESGDLVVLTQFTGPPQTWGVTIYDYATSTSSATAQLFSATGLAADGEPVDLHRLAAGNGYIMVVGTVRADVIDVSLGTTERSGAVWVTDGTTTAIRSQQEAFANYNANPQYTVASGYIRGTVVSSQVGLYRTTVSYDSSKIDVQTF
jgi:hypothetical protein